MYGNLHTFKARVITKSYSRTHGIDYDQTFLHIVMIKSTRILFSIAACYDYEIMQMDVITFFVNRNLLDDGYMVQPEDFVDPNQSNKVCKLNRSL